MKEFFQFLLNSNCGTCSNWELYDLDLIRTVMQDLKSEMIVVIKEADKGSKGSAVVAYDGEDYCKEAYRQLNNISVYEELVNSPISQLQKEIINVVPEIQVCEQALSGKEVEYSQVRTSKLGSFLFIAEDT